MNELKLVTALLAGLRLRKYDGRFILSVGKEDLDGEDIQKAAQSLTDKGILTGRSYKAGNYGITAAGHKLIKELIFTPYDSFYREPEYEGEIYTGTAFICNICKNFADLDRDEVEMHIADEHGDDHSDPEDE